MSVDSNGLITSETTLDVRIKNMDEKFKLLMDEAEKRNGQRFDAQQEAVATAMVAQEKAVLAAMAAAEKAVTKAEVASEKRFESVNEFRKTLSDQTGSFLTRAEFGVQYAALGDKLEVNSTKVSEIEHIVGGLRERTAGRNDLWITLISLFSVLISTGSLITLILRHV